MDTLKIQRHIFGTNECNRITKYELCNIILQLKQYLGKKIYIQSGMAKAFIIDFSRPEARTEYGMNFPRTNVIFRSTNKEISLYVELDYSIKVPNRDFSTPISFFNWITIGELSDGGFVLSKVFEVDEIITRNNQLTDLNEQDELEAIRKYFVARKELIDARNKVNVPTDVYDSGTKIY